MIRGIILLILSCVVLTLQTDQYCSCNNNRQPTVYEAAEQYLPTPCTKTIDYTVRPDDGQGLRTWYDQVNQPNDQYIKQTSTTDLLGLTRVVEGVLRTVGDLVQELTSLRLLWITQKLGVLNVVEDVLVTVRSLLSGCNSPLNAVPIVRQLTLINNKNEHVKQTDNWITSSLNAATSQREMVGAQQSIVNDYVSISQKLDDKQRSCGNGPRCTRGGLLDGLLGGLLGGLLDTVLNLVKGLLETVLTKVTNLGLALDIYINHLTGLDLGLYRIIGTVDLIAHDLWILLDEVEVILQNLGIISFEDACNNFGKIINDENAVAHYVSLVDTALGQSYSLKNVKVVCPGIAVAGVRLPIVSDLVCDITGLLGVNANINVAHDLVDIRTAATTVRDGFKVVTLGTTGASNVQADLISIDIKTGEFKIRITLLRQVIELLNTLLGRDLLGIIPIEGVVRDVTGLLSGVVGGLDGITGVTSLRNEIEKTTTEINSAQHLPMIPFSNVVNTVTGPSSVVQNTIRNSNNIKEQAGAAVTAFTNSRTQDQEKYKTILDNYNNEATLANARVASCKNEYLKARLDCELHPGDQTYTDIFETKKVALSSALEEALYISELIKRLLSVIESLLGEITHDLEVVVVLLDETVQNLERTIRGVTDILKDVVNILNPVSRIISSIRPTSILSSLLCNNCQRGGSPLEILNTVGNIVNNVDGVVQNVVGTVDNTVNTVVETATHTVDTVVNTAGNVVNTAGKTVGNVVNTAGKTVGNVVNTVGKTVGNVVPIIRTVTDTLGRAVHIPTDAVGNIVITATGTGPRVVRTLTDTLGNVFRVVTDTEDNLLNTVDTAVNTVTQTVGHVVHTVTDTANHLLPITLDAAGNVVCTVLGTVEEIVPVVLDTAAELLTELRLVGTVTDIIGKDETMEDVRNMHCQMLKSAVAACSQNPYVTCTPSPCTRCQKRSVEDPTEEELEYLLTIANQDTQTAEKTATTTTQQTTTVNRATQESGMKATPTTSSASSLVSSFLIAFFLSVLCFF